MTQGRFCELEPPEKVKLDVKDRKIITLLTQDARMPLTQVSRRVALSRDAVNYRIARLEKKGIILKFIPEINLRRMGFRTYHVFMVLDERHPEKQKELEERIKSDPSVLSLITYSDTYDMEFMIIAKTVEEFDRTITKITTEFPAVIMQKDKLEVINRYTSSHLPFAYYHDDVKVKSESPGREQIKMDEKDFRILKLLCEDCRMSSYKIASKVGLSADGVGYRIRKLIDGGIIERFTITVDLTKLGYTWYTYCVRTRTFNDKNEAKFREYIRKHPYILYAARCLGDWDFVIYLASDHPRNFHSTIKEVKRVFSDIIHEYTTFLAAEEIYFNCFPKTVSNMKELRL